MSILGLLGYTPFYEEGDGFQSSKDLFTILTKVVGSGRNYAQERPPSVAVFFHGLKGFISQRRFLLRGRSV